MHFLAIDQSTSATKAFLLDAQGRIVDRESREHQQHYPQPGWVEHDADEIWGNVLRTLQEVLRRNPAEAQNLGGLALTNQRETVVIFERSSGRPLHRAIVWQCRRGEPLCGEMEQAGRGNLLRERTGLKLDPYFSASKLSWVLRQDAGLRARVESGSALVGTIDTYLIYRLTEGKVFATDSTNASRTLLFNINTLDWDDALLALWQVPRSALPEVRESFAQFGQTRLGGLLKASLPICGVMGDSQASLLAQRCLTPGATKVTFGTGSSLLMNIGHRPRISRSGVLTALAWCHGGVPTYAFEGIVVSSASTLTWLRDQLGLASDIATLEQLAKAVPDTGGVHLVPAFNGLGLPHWQPQARAALFGLSSHSDRRHVARAAFESIAFQIRDALGAMCREAGVSAGTLSADGGPTVSDFLMQMTADLAEAELFVPTRSECSCQGVWLAAQIGLGWQPGPGALAEASLEGRRFSPRLTSGQAAERGARWTAAVAAVVGGIRAS